MKRAKYILLTFLLACCGWAVQAQQIYNPKTDRYRIYYTENHFLRQQGNVLHFVKANLEWPVVLNGRQMKPLQRYLTKELFGREGFSPQQILNHFLDSLGTPITQVPDGDGFRTYYITLDLTEIEYVADRYVSMRLVYQRKPKDVAEQATQKETLFTYDLINDRVMTANELLKASARKPDTENWWNLTKSILYNVSDYLEQDDDVYSLWDGACLTRVGLILDLKWMADDLYHHLALIAQDEARQFLSKEARKLLDAPLPEGQTPTGHNDIPLMTDTATVYILAEEMPTFQGFTASSAEMRHYMAKNVRYPDLEQYLMIEGRVVVQFIVEKDGTLSSLAVVRPLSPGIDRETIRVFTQMPRWQPGRIQGQPVRTLINLPVTFKVE